VILLVLYAAFVVLWGNLTSTALDASAWLPGGSWSFVIAGAALVTVSLLFARAMGMRADDLGLRGDPLRAALLGGGLGALLALAGVLVLRTAGAAIVGRPIEYAPLAAVTGTELARHVLFFLPLGDILPEEIAFRGVLLGGLLRRYGGTLAIALAGLVFALWHVAVAYATIGDTTLGPPSAWFWPAIAGALLVVLVGGAAFAWLRVRTRSLASTIAAHWAFNAVILIGLWSSYLNTFGLRI
jgi:membrane protease YdiL (CAAX protease family)